MIFLWWFPETNCIIKVRDAYIGKIFLSHLLPHLYNRSNIPLRESWVFCFSLSKSQNICENTWGGGGQWSSTCTTGFRSSLFSVVILCLLLKQSICPPGFNYNWKFCIEDPDPCALDNWWISTVEVFTACIIISSSLPFSPSPSCPPLCLSVSLSPFPVTLKKWLMKKGWWYL